MLFYVPKSLPISDWQKFRKLFPTLSDEDIQNMKMYRGEDNFFPGVNINEEASMKCIPDTNTEEEFCKQQPAGRVLTEEDLK